MLRVGPHKASVRQDVLTLFSVCCMLQIALSFFFVMCRRGGRVALAQILLVEFDPARGADGTEGRRGVELFSGRCVIYRSHVAAGG